MNQINELSESAGRDEQPIRIQEPTTEKRLSQNKMVEGRAPNSSNEASNQIQKRFENLERMIKIA